MSRGTYAIRRARRKYWCTETGYHIIHPGDLYLCAECPPEHESNRGRKWWTIKACLKCAEEFGLHTSETRKQLEGKE